MSANRLLDGGLILKTTCCPFAQEIKARVEAHNESQYGFVAIGAGHLAGVIKRLQEMGYTVTPRTLVSYAETKLQDATQYYLETITLSAAQEQALRKSVKEIAADPYLPKSLFQKPASLLYYLGFIFCLNQIQEDMTQQDIHIKEKISSFLSSCISSIISASDIDSRTGMPISELETFLNYAPGTLLRKLKDTISEGATSRFQDQPAIQQTISAHIETLLTSLSEFVNRQVSSANMPCTLFGASQPVISPSSSIPSIPKK